jgi:hypothetical protein
VNGEYKPRLSSREIRPTRECGFVAACDTVWVGVARLVHWLLVRLGVNTHVVETLPSALLSLFRDVGVVDGSFETTSNAVEILAVS